MEEMDDNYLGVQYLLDVGIRFLRDGLPMILFNLSTSSIEDPCAVWSMQ